MKEHFPYLFWAYNLIWIFIAGYLGILMAKQRSLRRQIDELKDRLRDEPAKRVDYVAVPADDRGEPKLNRRPAP